MVYRSSFLSQRSYSILCSHNSDDIVSSDLNDFIIKFDLLPDYLITPLSEEQYDVAITYARPFIHKVATCFSSISTYDLYTRYASSMSWLSDPCEYLELHSRLSRPEASEKLLIALRLTALIDFSLNALLWQPKMNSPNMLKETLQSKKLEALLGTNCILILKLLFGSVHSYNLRNILWHGFVSPTDMLNLDKHLIPFIFAIIISIGHRLNLPEINQEVQKITRRPSSLGSLKLCDTLVATEKSNISSTFSLTNLANHHPISSTSNMEYIRFIDSLFHTEPRRYIDILCLSLVCLSMIIRCKFADFIKWPEGVTTSENRFFLTLDSIIEFQFTDIIPHLPPLDLISNLNDFCDLRLINILCDILSAQTGPRLKDKLSHGELWQNRTIKFIDNELIVPDDYDFQTASILVYFCLAASFASRIPEQDNHRIDPLSWIQFYQPRFNLCDQFLLNVSNLKRNYSLIKTHVENQCDFVRCKDLPLSLFYAEFESTYLLWFPNNAYCDLNDYMDLTSGQHWSNIVSWSYLVAKNNTYFWSSRPATLLSRLNLILKKINHTLFLTDQYFTHFSNVDLDNLPTRRYNTFLRSVTSLDCLSSLNYFILRLTNSIWSYWLGGSCQTIQAKLNMINKYSTNLQERASLIEYLDKMADKLIMWITKSQWELITEFFNAISLPKPKTA